MSTPSYYDPGTYNLKDCDQGKLVGKVHVESAAADTAGGRAYVVHYALVMTSINETNWGTYVKPTQTNNKQLKWEGTGETQTQFINWINDSNHRSHLLYVTAVHREQDVVPAPG